MSKTPEPDINLDLHFLPAWARQPSEINRYAHYDGSESARREKRGGRPRRSDRAARDGAPGDRGSRRGGRPPEKGRGGPRGRERSGGRPRYREEPPRLPEVKVSFVPETRGVESLARQIKLTGRAYPVFEIAQLILSKPDRYQAVFEVVKREDGQTVQELWHCSIDNTLWMSIEDAISHVFRKHFELFYEAEKTPTDPPKGTYTFVAQCGLSGTILGPPNYHDYQIKLRKLHASRYSRMPLAAYQAKIRIVRDEEVVKKWIEEQSFKTEYVCLNVPEPLKLLNRDEAEKHFREVHASTVIRPVESWTGSGEAVLKAPNSLLRQLMRRAWEDQRRFPLKVVTVLSQQMAGHGLQFFKVNKTVTHVCVARPHYLDLEDSPVSEGVRRIVEYVRQHEGCSRKGLVESLAPASSDSKTKSEGDSSAAGAPSDSAAQSSGPDESRAGVDAQPKPSPEQTAVVGDLHWLIHQGHVIEFADGRLESAQKPKPKSEPKPQKNEGEGTAVRSSRSSSQGTTRGDSPESAASQEGQTAHMVEATPKAENEHAAAHSPSEPPPEKEPVNDKTGVRETGGEVAVEPQSRVEPEAKSRPNELAPGTEGVVDDSPDGKPKSDPGTGGSTPDRA